MATSAGYAVLIKAVDQTAGPLDAINKRLAKLSAPAERFNKALAKFGDTSGISRVAEGVRDLGSGAATAFQALDRMASPLAAITSVGSIAGMAALTRKWAEFGTVVGQTAYRLNMPVEKLGALRGAMRLAGGSAADMDSGLAGLDEKLRGAAFGRDSSAIQTLQSLHIGFGDAAHGARKASDALGDVADSLVGQTPGAQHRILESLGLNDSFLPLLKNGRKGLEEFQNQAEKTGGVMTGEMVQNATEMNKAWQRLGLDFEGVGNKIVNSWSGTVTGVLEGASKWIEKNKDLSANIAEIGTAILALGALKPAAWVLELLGLSGLAATAGTAAALASPILLSGDTPSDPLLNKPYDPVTNPNFFDRNGAGGRFFYNHAPTWAGGRPDITKPSGPSAAAGTMQRVHDYFKSKGLTEEQTAGVLSNVSAESSFNSAASGDNGTSYGLFQHHGSRLAAMQARYHTATPSEQQQLDYTWHELNTSERATLDRLRGVSTAGQAGATQAGAIFTGFERPADGPGEAFRRGQGAGQFMTGNVQVEVTLRGAPPGTTARVASSGAVTAPPPRVEMPMAGVH